MSGGDIRAVVTLAWDAGGEDTGRAHALASRLGCEVVRRRGVERLCREHGVAAVVVVRRGGVAVHVPGGTTPFRFHGGMGVTRLRRLAGGHSDALLDAARVREGETVLDATAGRGADALVLAHAVGPSGRVLALESSALLHAALADGLARPSPTAEVEAIRGRIEAARADHRAWLRAAGDRSVDVVYFDPMYVAPRAAWSDLEVLRRLADPQPLTRETLAEAARVARRCVVVADDIDGRLLETLGLEPVPSGRRAWRRYGVLERLSGT